MTATTALNTTRWQRTRARIRERDGHRCTLCGTPDRLSVHHIIPRTQAPDLAYEDSNLITVCVACHNRIERRGARRFLEGPQQHPGPHGVSLPAAGSPERPQSRDW